MAAVAARPEVFAWSLPYESWDEEGGLALLTDPGGDSMAAFWKAGTLSVELESTCALGGLADHVSSIFRSVPEEATLQILLVAHPTDGAELRRWLAHGAADAPVLVRRGEERAQFLRSFWFDMRPALFFAKDLDLYITLRSKPVPIPWSIKDPTAAERAATRRVRDEFLAAAEDIQSAAETVGIPMKRLDYGESFALLWRLLNPHAALAEEHPTPHQATPIAEQLLSAPIQRHWDTGTLRLDGMHVRVLSAHAPPPATTTGQFCRELAAGVNQLALVDLVPFGWLALSFVKPDQEHYRVKLAAKNKMARAQAGFSSGAKAVLRDVEQMRDTLADNRDAFHTYIHVVLGADDAETLAARVRTVRSALAALSFGVSAEDAYTDLAFRYALPAGVAPVAGPRDGMGRAITLTDLGAAHVAPFYFGPESTRHADHLFLDKRGRVVATSLFDNSSQVGHTVIVGPTGSGKSMFLKTIITDVLRKGGYVVLLNRHTMGLDTNDYHRYARLVGDIGQFIDFDVDRPPDLDICAGKYDASMNLFLTHLLCEIATLGRTHLELRPSEVNSISEKVAEAYDYHARHQDGRIRLGDIRDMLEGSEDRVVRDLGKSLAMFTGDGAYSKFFDGHNDNLIRKGARFICYELSGIANYKEIRIPLIMALFYKAGRFFQSLPTDVPKLFVSEEAAALLLESPRTADLLQKQGRLYRKMRAACVLVTQHARDLDSQHGLALLGDKANLILLRHPPEEAADTTRFLNLTPEQGAALHNLKQSPGRFGQILWLSERVQGTLYNLLGPHYYWWLTSHSADTAALEKARARLAAERGGDVGLDELIEHMARQHPWGVENS